MLSGTGAPELRSTGCCALRPATMCAAAYDFSPSGKRPPSPDGAKRSSRAATRAAVADLPWGRFSDFCGGGIMPPALVFFGSGRPSFAKVALPPGPEPT